MLIRLISLVVLSLCLNITYIYSNEDILILPKEKPSVFKNIDKKVIEKNQTLIPQKKPGSEPKLNVEKNVKKTIEKIEAVKDIKKKNISNFILPKNKPLTYRVVKKEKEKEKSKILSKKDFEKAKEVISYIKAGKWNSARKTASRVKDREFKTLIDWMYLKTTGNQASFNEYQKFIDRNPDYPRINRLKYLAEHKIYLKNNSPSAIINWFNRNPPVSGMGKIKLAEAYLEQGKNDKTLILIKEGWKSAKINKRDLSYYRAKFKKFLTSDDHIERANYLAWENKYWDLKRMLRYLPKDEKALYNARQILMSNSYGVDKAISQVPDHLKNDIGLEYDRLKWRNRRGRLEQSLEILYENANKSEDSLVKPELWWKQRESIVRSLIYKKRYKTAYKVASEHSMSSGPAFAEAEWLSGWIALSFLDSGEYAINHFHNFYNNVGYPISLARGAYWLGTSYKSVNDIKKSEQYFKEGANFPTTYYGQLSFSEIYPDKDFELKNNSFFDEEYKKKFLKNRLIKSIFLLKELNASKYSKDIIKHLANLNIEKGSEILAAEVSTTVERYDYAIQISKQASYQKRFHNKFNYPIINTPKEVNNKIMPNSELILAIIRQESEFDKKANSYVGARGMMQLMKYTAKIVAKNAKLPYSISRLTTDPEYNIKLGSYYFDSLLENYNGVYPFAIAAYNAGPNRVKTWRRVNGDPSKSELSFINWIELIRFKETRNYVQRVLENVNVYKYMLSQKPVKLNGFYK